jgi:biopolymer transport protein ExbD
MSADVKDDNQPYDEINVTPMLDLAYVLLVVFIIMTTASVQGIKVEAPQTQTVSSLAKPQTKAITITAAGDVFLDAYPVDMATLEARLGRALREGVGRAGNLQAAGYHRSRAGDQEGRRLRMRAHAD